MRLEGGADPDYVNSKPKCIHKMSDAFVARSEGEDAGGGLPGLVPRAEAPPVVAVEILESPLTVLAGLS